MEFPHRINPVTPLPNIEVAPGIVAVGYYSYRRAHLKEILLRLSWQTQNKQTIEVRDGLYDLLNQLDRKVCELKSLERGEPCYIGISDNHMVVEWQMHGHRIYTWYTDGSVYIGTEIDEWYW